MSLAKILPGSTRPWRKSFARRHSPPAADYETYRPCLRWEFGFSCAFCLCHEVDLMLGGVEGWAITQIEHFVPKSRTTSLRDVYSNCFYICRRCNNARGVAANIDADGRKLLNPCVTVWRKHFTLVNGELRFRADDKDAEYTCKAYKLNDPVKVRLRRLRSRAIKKRVGFLRRTRGLEAALRNRLKSSTELDSNAELLKLVHLAQEMSNARTMAREELFRFRPIPEDRDKRCLCGHRKNHTLPAVLEEQVVDLQDII